MMGSRHVTSTSDADKTRQRDSIPTPSFRRIASRTSAVAGAKGTFERENMDEESAMSRHRPFENAERRERKRECELVRYEEYIANLRFKYPELFK